MEMNSDHLKVKPKERSLVCLLAESMEMQLDLSLAKLTDGGLEKLLETPMEACLE